MRARAVAMVALIAFLGLLPVLAFFGAGDGVAGTDTDAQRMVEQIDPEYTPWFTSRLRLSSTAERGVFALQAAAGAAFIGYYFGSRRRRGRSEGAE